MISLEMSFNKLNQYLLVIFFVSGFCDVTFAADPIPGSACSTNNAHMRSGGPENSGVFTI